MLALALIGTEETAKGRRITEDFQERIPAPGDPAALLLYALVDHLAGRDERAKEYLEAARIRLKVTAHPELEALRAEVETALAE